MARGWESKSVEAQIEQSISNTNTTLVGYENSPSAVEVQNHIKKNSLLLSRKQVLHQLEQSNNPRYSELLRRSLTELDAQLAGL